MRRSTKKLVLFAAAVGLTAVAGVAFLLCQEGDCFQRLKDDVTRAFESRSEPRLVPEHEIGRAPEAVPATRDAPSDTVEVPQPVVARPCPGAAERALGCYERMQDLRRRFAEGGPLTRVSRPRPQTRLSLVVPEPEPATVWVDANHSGFSTRGPSLRRKVPSWRAPRPVPEPLPANLGQVPAFEPLLPD